jgi:hypothetical protein
MDRATRYRCRFCDAEKWVPESPQSCANQIRTGCHGLCESITPHHPVGQPEVRG